MGNLWTPPRGFFPTAVTWFHPGNIIRCQTLLRMDINVTWNNISKILSEFTPGCDGAAVGKPAHIWQSPGGGDEAWGSVAGCSNGDYSIPAVDMPSNSGLYATIGTGVPATLTDLWHAFNDSTFINPAQAIRYGWLFTNGTLVFWQHGIPIIHWLPPA